MRYLLFLVILALPACAPTGPSTPVIMPPIPVTGGLQN